MYERDQSTVGIVAIIRDRNHSQVFSFFDLKLKILISQKNFTQES